MKPEPTTTAAITGTTVEYEVRFAVGPKKGRKRVQAAAPIEKAASLVPPPRPVAPPAPPPPETVALPEVARPSTTAPGAAVPKQPDTGATASPRVPKITLLLVLGHHFERLVRDGTIKDYAEIARRIGMTRARVTQITNLTLLAPGIQEEILLSQSPNPLAIERPLRCISGMLEWYRQQEVWRVASRRPENQINK